jgi:hypothetical protein
MAAKKSAAKKTRGARKKRSAKKLGRRGHVVIDVTAKPGAFASRALSVFNDGVQKEYARLARKGVATVVLRDGEVVTGIPRRVGGRFVVGEPQTRYRK